MVGVAVLAVLVIGYRRANAVERRVNHRLTAGLAARALIGVGLDTLHRTGPASEAAGFFLTLAENGGELVVMSVLVVWIYRATRRSAA